MNPHSRTAGTDGFCDLFLEQQDRRGEAALGDDSRQALDWAELLKHQAGTKQHEAQTILHLNAAAGSTGKHGTIVQVSIVPIYMLMCDPSGEDRTCLFHSSACSYSTLFALEQFITAELISMVACSRTTQLHNWMITTCASIRIADDRVCKIHSRVSFTH